jgi:hypothetical protein
MWFTPRLYQATDRVNAVQVSEVKGSNWLVNSQKTASVQSSLAVVVRSWQLRHGASSGTQSKGNVRRWKPLPDND